jgi:outer membrane protein TolC
MMKMKKMVILTLAALVFTGIKAQEKLILSLEEALAYAVEYNKTVKNADLAVQEAQKRINESISTGLPQADATVDYSNYMGAEMEIRFQPDAPPTKIPFDPTSNLNLTVSQLIFNGNYIVGLQAAKIYKQITETGYLKTEQDIKEQVTKSYYSALVSDRSIGIILSNLENTREIFDKTRAMASVGMAEKLDVDQFEVQVTSLENALKSAKRQKELSYNLLRFQLGVPVETLIELSDSLNGMIRSFEYQTLAEADFALESNLDYQLMLKQEQLSEKQVSLQKMNYLPTLTGFYRYTNKLLKPQFDLSPKNVIGLNLSVPILSSGMRNAQLSQARIQFETTQNNKDLLTSQLLLQERQMRYNLATAMEQFENRKKNVDVAYRIYKNYQFKYEQGIASSLDLSISNNNYLQAESDYLMAIISLFDARLALQKLMNSI